MSQDEDAHADAYVEVYTIEKRKEIVDYWQNDGNLRKFASVQNRYRLVGSLNTLKTWKKRIYGGEGTCCTIWLIFHND